MADWIAAAQAKLSRINWLFCIVASFLLIVMMVITVYEVIVRYVFNAPTIWTLEISQYSMLIAMFCAAAYTQEVDGHIRADFVLGLLSAPKKRVANIASSSLAIVFFSLLVWKSSELAWTAFLFGMRSMTMLSIPLLPIYVFVPVGSFLMLLQGIVQFLRLISGSEGGV